MTWISQLLESHPDWPQLTIAALAAIGVAYALGEVAARLARWALWSLSGQGDAAGFRSPVARRPIRIIRVIVMAGAAALLVAPALRAAGASITIGIEPRVLVEWLLGTGLRIATIVLLAFIAVWVVGLAVARLEQHLASGATQAAAERAKRARTICTLARRGLDSAAIGVALLMILREIGLDITPILAGAGVIGLAMGFGAQTLVRDVIAGVFMILEDQIRVGDVAVIDGTGGMVESIGLRTTVLRDLGGVVHVFPNGSISRLSNRTKDFSYALLDVGVAYKEDSDRVVEVLREVGEGLCQDPAFVPSILDPLEVLGLDAFGDSQVTIRVRLKTLPRHQWTVGRELRRRIKKAFDARGIEIPFPHMSVYFGEASRPWQIQQTASGADPAASKP